MRAHGQIHLSVRRACGNVCVAAERKGIPLPWAAQERSPRVGMTSLGGLARKSESGGQELVGNGWGLGG